MAKFTIQCNFTAYYTTEVDAKDEGEALEKARNKAEEADLKEFVICGERESQILSRGD